MMILKEPILIGVKAVLLTATSGTDLVANLLTGGGFMFLAAVMGGLALWNKNQSESIASINKASREFVEGARTEVASAREDANNARTEAHNARLQAAAARRELEQERETYAAERQRIKRWLHDQKILNEDHTMWDADIKREAQRLGGTVPAMPPLATYLPDDPNFPFR